MTSNGINSSEKWIGIEGTAEHLGVKLAMLVVTRASSQMTQTLGALIIIRDLLKTDLLKVYGVL